MDFFDSDECTWTDMTVLIGGSVVTKIRRVRYKRSQETMHLFAGGKKAIGIQTGNETNEGEIGVLKGALDDMNRAAKIAGGRSILDVPFDVVTTYAPKGSRKLQTDVLVGVRITEYEKGWEQGAMNMDVNMPMKFLDLLES